MTTAHKRITNKLIPARECPPLLGKRLGPSLARSALHEESKDPNLPSKPTGMRTATRSMLHLRLPPLADPILVAQGQGGSTNFSRRTAIPLTARTRVHGKNGQTSISRS